MLALGDCDGDGDLDLAVPSGDVWLRDADAGFGAKVRHVAREADVLDLQDVDGDGQLDALSFGSTVMLQRGHGGCSFDAAVASSAAPCAPGFVTAVTPTDADLDGLRDELLVCGGTGAPPTMLLLGLGDGRFEVHPIPLLATRARASTGLPTFSFLSSDLDSDGAVDGALLSDSSTGWFGWGVAGDPTAFERDDLLTDLADQLNTMSAAPLDFDRDGAIDWFWAGNGGGNALLRSRAGRTFDELADAASLNPAKGSPTLFQSWSSVAFDADLDGWDDLLVLRLQGRPDDPGGEQGARPYLFVNQHDGTFGDLADQVGPGPLRAYEAVCGDLDGDGRVGCVVAEFETVAVVENLLDRRAGWAGLKLRGTVSDPEGLGAFVDVEGDSPPQRHLLIAPPSTYAHHPVGLVLRASSSELTATVRWPSGLEQRVALGAGRYVTAVEPRVVELSSRSVPADGSSTVTVTVRPGEGGAASAAVELSGSGRWQGPETEASGVVTRTLVAPGSAGDAVLTVTLDGRALAVRPKVRFR
jgi:hypothetical protein